jgi:hypothetical protein
VLLPFDMRPDKVGWTIVEVATNRPATIADLPLVELSLDDADRLVDELNAQEMRSRAKARLLADPSAVREEVNATLRRMMVDGLIQSFTTNFDTPSERRGLHVTVMSHLVVERGREGYSRSQVDGLRSHVTRELAKAVSAPSVTVQAAVGGNRSTELR